MIGRMYLLNQKTIKAYFEFFMKTVWNKVSLETAPGKVSTLSDAVES